MKQVPVKNTTKMTIWVGGTMIPPDETRHVPEHQVPEHLRPAPVEQEEVAEEAPNPLLALLEKSIADIVIGFPDLSDEDLQVLKQAEDNGKTRVGLMEEFAAEELRRASESSEWIVFDQQIAGATLEQLRDLETSLIESDEMEKAERVSAKIMEFEDPEKGTE